jgi:hypothetical protein
MFGRITSAKTIIPIPPIQWVADLQKSNPLGNISISVNIVDPVVVNPETLSNQAFVKVNSPPHITYGTTPNKQVKSQLKTTIRKPSRELISFVCGTYIKGKIPNKNAIIDEYNNGNIAESIL